MSIYDEFKYSTTFARRRRSISRLHLEVTRCASERCQVCVAMSATMMTQRRRVTRSATVVRGNYTDTGWTMSLVVCNGAGHVHVWVWLCAFAQCLVTLDQEPLMCVHLCNGVVSIVIYTFFVLCMCCLFSVVRCMLSLSRIVVYVVVFYFVLLCVCCCCVWCCI